MSTQVVVPLNKRDELTHLLPYLQVLAKPGSEIVFLWRHREEISWVDVQLTAMQTQIGAVYQVKRLAANTAIERQSRWAEEKVRSVRVSLHAKGMVVVVKSYSGSLRNGIAAVREAGSETVVLFRNHRRITEIVTSQIRRAFRLLSSSETQPILYLRPGSQHD